MPAMSWYPTPKDDGECERWAETAKRHRMIDGVWQQDALDREADFFAPEVRMFLPSPELSRNPFAAITRQVACLYDREWTVSPDGVFEESAETVLTPELLPLCQRRLVYTVGMGECLMRVDVFPDGQEVRYRVVTPDLVEAEAGGADPSYPTKIREYRPRRDPTTRKWEWTVETWDTTPGQAPEFAIEAVDSQGKRADVTAKYMPGFQDAFPYTDAEGAILPYGFWHAEVSDCLWMPYRWMEIVAGTTTTSALWTFWLSGVRDGAHPQRWTLNAQPVTATTAISGTTAVEWIKTNPLTILPFRAIKGGENVQIGQFQPAMDSKSAGEAIEAFESGLAIYAGISPADLQRSASGMSGYSIVVSREGLRTARRRMETPTRLGDRKFLATAARLSNRYLSTSLPTEPRAWRVDYAEIGRSQEEVHAEVETVKMMLEMGQISPVDAQMRLNPGMTEEEAIRKLAQIADVRRVIATAEAPAGVATDPAALPTKPADPAELAAAGEEIQALALNGAQVSSLLEVLSQVSAGALTTDGAAAVITRAFPMITPAAAWSIVSGARRVDPTL